MNYASYTSNLYDKIHITMIKPQKNVFGIRAGYIGINVERCNDKFSKKWVSV